MDITIPGIPFTLSPSHGSSWDADPKARTLAVAAAPHSDIFVDPGGESQVNAETLLNAVTLLGAPPQGDFRLWARVRVDFASAFDAGVLMIWLSETHWAKFCFEFSPAGQPMVVSVVNKGVADDANAFDVDAGSVWLRVSRVGAVYAFHASLDGRDWQFVRVFVLDEPGMAPVIGFEAQSPTGEGCDVVFDNIGFDTVSLGDLRDGS